MGEIDLEKSADENGRSEDEQRSHLRTVKSETQHSLVQPITPDEEIPLDYMESEELPTPAVKQPKQEVFDGMKAVTTPSSPQHRPDDNGNGHDDNDDRSRSPDYDEAEIDDIIDENLELRSLNEDDEMDGEQLTGDMLNSGLTEAVSDDDNGNGGELPAGARRPRTPLSPCPDDLSGPDDDADADDEETAAAVDESAVDAAGPSSSDDNRRRHKITVSTVGGDCTVTGSNADMPAAYRTGRRRARGGRRVRLRQAAAMRSAAAKVVARRTVVDARILANRRQRLMRLREVHDRRLSDADRGRPATSSRHESTNRRTRLESVGDCTSRRVPAGRWIPSRVDEGGSRRNPSYYPSSSSTRSRSPLPPRRALPPLASGSHRHRSPVPRGLTPPRRLSRAPFERRIPASLPSRNHRSRSPRDRIPYRSPLPSTSGSSFSAPRYAARRSPPLISRYPPVDVRDFRHPRDSAPPLRGERLRHAALPPVAFTKRWRCPKREPSPV